MVGVLGWLRLDIVKLMLLALPTLAVNHLLFDITIPSSQSSWGAGALLLPMLAAATILGWTLRGHRPIALGRNYLAFFFIYCLMFSIATGSNLLNGPRRLLAGYDKEIPRNFLALNRLGDWHYWLAPPAPPALDLLVLTIPSSRLEPRYLFTILIHQARIHDAKGIAFDYYFEDPSRFDQRLAREINDAESGGLPVLLGYRHTIKQGLVVRSPLPEVLSSVVAAQRQGHLSGYLEIDNRVRLVPIDLPGVSGQPSLSYQIASVLRGNGLEAQGNRLIRFTKPHGGVHQMPIDLAKPDQEWELMRDRFVLVGTGDASDVWHTPFGRLPGVMVHAYSAHSLRTDHQIRRLDPRWTFPMIFSLCYALTLFHVKGASYRFLLFIAIALSLAVVTTAACAIYFGLLWMDVIYPLLAIWVLTLLFRVRAMIPTPTISLPTSIAGLPDTAPGPGSSTDQHDAGHASFDVFLSHNSSDKPQVRCLAEALRARGLRPWVDEQELIPGRNWLKGLEEALLEVRASAILVGKDGLGLWEIPEMYAALDQCVKRGMPIIPVLLPGASERPELPLFLTQYTPVDMRDGLSDEKLDQLEWGITGVKP